MKRLDPIDTLAVSGGALQRGSPAVAGIGPPVDSLPTPITPVAVPQWP